MRKQIVEPVGFFIQGENVVIANPCIIPIKMLEDVLKEKRKKNQVTACFILKIPIPKELKNSHKVTGFTEPNNTKLR